MFDCQPTTKGVIIGDGTRVNATKTGSVKLEDEIGRSLTLSQVLYVPSFAKNIVSVGALTEAGNELTT
jgi:hypothetical protein